MFMVVSAGSAQVASHAPTAFQAQPVAKSKAVLVTDKAVARVNGATLTDRDLVREMYAIFPYARQHNGFPKAMEAEIRQGALQMIIFEELVYQEAIRRKMVVPAARISRAQSDFHKQFSSSNEYQEYLKVECKGSPQVLRQKIRRSLLIEALLKAEVQGKATVSLAAVKAYYGSNPREFEHGETFSLQTISIVPPPNANAEIQKEARKRAEDALRQAKATKSYREFGLLAEKLSDDDWHVNMGDRKAMLAAQMPPPLLQAARAMKPGQVSDLLQFGPNYTLFRLNAHTPVGKIPFDEVKTTLRSNLQKAKTNQLRSELNRRLQKNAKVEVL